MQEKIHNELQRGLVSVIVPVYNVENYLDRCIESIVNQTYRNLEIILIDDGSKDQSGMICDRWAQKDSRIHVVHKENSGAGFSRNVAMSIAAGEYLYAVDSDDFIDLNTIQNCYDAAEKYDADLVVFGACRIDENDVITENEVLNNDIKVFEGNDVQEYFLPGWLGTYPSDGFPVKPLMSGCTSFVRFQLIKDYLLQYETEKEMISEDVYFHLKLGIHLQKVVILPEIYYYYFINHNSLTHQYRADRFVKNRVFYDACYQTAKEAGLCEKVLKRIGNPYVSNVIGLLKMISCSNHSKKEKKKFMKEILLDSHLRTAVSRMDLDQEPLKRKIFLIGLKNGWYRFCTLLVFLKG